MDAVRVILDGLTVDGTVYRAGDVVQSPSSRLLELAMGETLLGAVVAEVVVPVVETAAERVVDTVIDIVEEAIPQPRAPRRRR